MFKCSRMFVIISLLSLLAAAALIAGPAAARGPKPEQKIYEAGLVVNGDWQSSRTGKDGKHKRYRLTQNGSTIQWRLISTHVSAKSKSPGTAYRTNKPSHKIGGTLKLVNYDLKQGSKVVGKVIQTSSAGTALKIKFFNNDIWTKIVKAQPKAGKRRAEPWRR